MEENTRVRNLYTLVKWINNVDPESQNRLISMTLGKYGFVNSDYHGPTPRHDEFWLSRIDREINANSIKGCFVLTPVRIVDRDVIDKLVPLPGLSTYTEFEEDGIRYILPADREQFYVMPLFYRRAIKSVRSVIVVNFMFAGFGNSDRYFYFPQEAGYSEEQQIIRRLQQTPYDGISMQPDHVARDTCATRGTQSTCNSTYSVSNNGNDDKKPGTKTGAEASIEDNDAEAY